MPELKRFSVPRKEMLLRVAMGMVVIGFLSLAARFYVPGKGMTSLILFGEFFADRYIPEIKKLSYHTEAKTYGYDAQWYVQIAVRPNPKDPEMRSAVDNLPYRARRILFCWTAYLFGFGKPEWIVQVYAIQNIVCWVALAWLMLRWFPPTSFQNLFRWTAVLLSFGLCASVRLSLVDGPSLFLVACGVALFEAGKPWWSALVLGVGGLGKETAILSAGVTIRPNDKRLKEWLAGAVRLGIIAAPILLWTYYIYRIYGPVGTNTGSDAFDTPFVAIFQKIQATIEDLQKGGKDAEYARGAVYTLIGLFTQFLFFVLRPRLTQPWWRVAIGYCILMIVLGWAVWEGAPGAASRVLLPMTLAFNVLVPRGKLWAVVLLLGNASVLTSVDLTRPPAGDGYKLIEATDSVYPKNKGPALHLDFSSGWYPVERSQFEQWLWAQESTEVIIHSSINTPILLNLRFEISALSPRVVSFGSDRDQLWSDSITKQRRGVVINHVIINPGENRLWWRSDRPADASANPADTRKLAFRIYNLEFRSRTMPSAIK